MQSIRAKEKGELLALDFLGPLPRSSRGVRHILVCVDVFTKAVQLYAIMRPTTKTVLKIILQRYIPTNGHVKKIITDQAKQFRIKRWSETLTQQALTVEIS